MSRTPLFLVATIAVVMAACSGDDTVPSTTGATTTVTTTTTPALSTTLVPLPSTQPPVTTTTIPPDVVTIWTDDATADAVVAIARDFTTRRGVDVEVIALPFPSILSEVLNAAEDGGGPDLFVGAHGWTGALRDAGAVAPVRGLPAIQRDAFIGPALEGFRLDGDLYGIPYAAETIALWVNSELAGTAMPPTFDALLDVCDTLPIEFTCLAVAGGAGVPEAYYQYPFVTAFGGSIFRYEPQVGYTADRAGIDEPEAVAASLYVAALGRGDYLPALDYVTAKQGFLAGEVAFWMTGQWEAEAIAEAAQTRGFSARVIPVPAIDGNPAQPFVDSLGIYLGATATTEAKIFLTDWLATGDAMVALAPQPPLFPAHTMAAGQLAEMLQPSFIDAMRSGVPTPNLSSMDDDVWEAWGAALTAIRDEGADPATTLASAGRIVRNLLGLPPPPADAGD